MDYYMIPLQHVVIVGGGPAGLYTAIGLKKAGVGDVTIIDPRLGLYTRPGHLDRSVFNAVYNVNRVFMIENRQNTTGTTEILL